MRETIKSVQKKGFSCHSRCKCKWWVFLVWCLIRWVHWSQVGEGRKEGRGRERGREEGRESECSWQRILQFPNNNLFHSTELLLLLLLFASELEGIYLIQTKEMKQIWQNQFWRKASLIYSPFFLLFMADYLHHEGNTVGYQKKAPEKKKKKNLN